MDEDAEGPAAEAPLLLLIMKERLRRLSRLPIAFWGSGSDARSSSNRPGGHACTFSSCCICRHRDRQVLRVTPLATLGSNTGLVYSNSHAGKTRQRLQRQLTFPS